MELSADRERPARVQAVVRYRRGARLLQFGVMWLVVGFAFALYGGFGLLSYGVVLGVGSALIAAGYRSLER
jgi:hypothetical protein